MPQQPPAPPAPPPPASSSSSSNSHSTTLGAAPPPLTKFPLHQTANAASPLITCSSSTGPLPNQTLLNLRTVLVASRFSATSRVQLKEDNKRLLSERQAYERKHAEEEGKVKEGERRRKREEEERRERERIEKVEREKVEAKAKEESENAMRRAKESEEDAARLKKGKERAIEDARQREGTVQNGESRETSVATTNGDVSMKDVKMPPPPTKKVPSKVTARSPEAEDDVEQPKPPRHDKKKRKRDHIINSDDSGSDDDLAEQPLLQKVRKLDSHQPSPSVPPTPTRDTLSLVDGLPPLDAKKHKTNPIERRLKEERFTKHSIPIKPPAPGGATAFYVPTHSLVPLKPPVVPPTPTPKRQADVSGDYSNAKPGQQIAHSTFTNWTEAYLRPFGEDDLAFLAAKPEDISPYIIPPLGKPYLQKWEEEDSDLPASHHSHHLQPSTSLHRNGRYPSPLEPRPLVRLRPEHLSEDAMGTENLYLGPLSERLVSALALEEGVKLLDRGEFEGRDGGDGFEDDEDDEGGNEGEGGDEFGSGQKRIELDAVDLEERIKRELRFIGLLPEEEVDWSSREDDEISTSLRACQRLLQHQVELNESRKAILMGIVKDRMAYQEYETARDAQERVIEAGWHKRQRTDNKKKKKSSQKDKDRRGGTTQGAGEEDPSKVPVSLALMEAVEKRNSLVECFKPFFDEDGDRSRWYGIPERSVYEGLLETIEEEDEGEVG